MKKLSLLISILSLSLFAECQIADIKISNDNYVRVYDANNKEISNGYLSSDGEVMYSNCMIIVVKANYIKVYNENCRLISSSYAGDSDAKVNVSGCNIISKSPNGYKKIYDRDLKMVSSGY